jgi:uncharacterized protein (UPF0335 family)
MDERDLEKIEEIFKRHIGILSEDFQHKLDIVDEGHQMLSEKLDRMDLRLERVEERLDKVETKLDGVAADLTAHRADTEIHRTGYQIREDTDS